ncbi:Uma2 family endonuclease [Pendulispora rubella]|uniref:Uma2 family endonuclease n=1 Tax=Pendulispora rubella TaxID=2741070 RepID=A0ABZ2LEK5_9BACT
MTQTSTKPYVTYRDYVDAEAKSETKHEWLDGVVYDMAGGTPDHGALALAMARIIGNALEGRPCRMFSSDVRVRVRATGLATYPDASIVCDRLELDPEDDHSITNPVVLVEILSDSTEGYDRGKKFENYRRIPSLREYVLVSQHEPRIEVYRRNDSGFWELHEWGVGEFAELTSVNARIGVDDVYRNPLTS